MKKNQPNKLNQDESRRTNVLLEEVRSNFKLLAEGQQGILDHLDRTDEQIASLKTNMNTLEATMHKGFVELRREIAELRKDLTMVLKEHEARLRALEATRA